MRNIRRPLAPCWGLRVLSPHFRPQSLKADLAHMGSFRIKASLKYRFSCWVHSMLLSTLRGHQKIKFRALTLWGQLWLIPGSLGTPDQGNDSHWGTFPTQVIRDVHSQSEWIHPGFLERVKENAVPSAHSFPQNGLVYQVFCEGRSASYHTYTHTHAHAHTHMRMHMHTHTCTHACSSCWPQACAAYSLRVSLCPILSPPVASLLSCVPWFLS